MRQTTFVTRIATGIDGKCVEDENIWMQISRDVRGTYLMGDSADARVFNRLVAQRVKKRLDRLQRGEDWARKWG